MTTKSSPNQALKVEKSGVLFQLVHRTPHRLRIQSQLPLSATVSQLIERTILQKIKRHDQANRQSFATKKGLPRYHYYPLTQTFVIKGSAERLSQAWEALSELTLEKVKEAYLESPTTDESVYSIVREAVTNRTLRYLFLPAPIRIGILLSQAFPFIKHGWKDLWKRRLTIDVLDMTAVGLSLLRADFSSASAIVFLLSLSDRLEDHTRRKSSEDLKKSLAFNFEEVWRQEGEDKVLVPYNAIQEGDTIIVYSGAAIPFDGQVVHGNASVNESNITGEFFPIHKYSGQSVKANTVLEEGELHIQVENLDESSSLERIVDLIADSEAAKPESQLLMERQANRLVKFNFLGALGAYLLTRNVEKTLSFLLVDYSCALRLTGPLINLTAMTQASEGGVVVKGGRFLEAMGHVDTIIFDKTGTLTSGKPQVEEVIPFEGYGEEEVLRVAACLEEHFHHPIAQAIVDKAAQEKITHEEMHAGLNYIVAHGIESSIDDKRVVIGSHHFIFDDEKVEATEEALAIIKEKELTHHLLYLAYDGQLIAIFTIVNQIRPEVPALLEDLHRQGKRLILLTGDQEERTLHFMEAYPFDKIISEVTPEEKYATVEEEQAAGRTVAMFGDGVNDSAALSLADIGISLSEASNIAQQVADVLLLSDNLDDLNYLQKLSEEVTERTHRSYQAVIGINSALILGGFFNVIPNRAAAYLHNLTTLATAVNALKDYDIDE